MSCHCPICDEKDEVYCVRLDRSFDPDDLPDVCTGNDCPWLTTLCGWEDRPAVLAPKEGAK